MLQMYIMDLKFHIWLQPKFGPQGPYRAVPPHIIGPERHIRAVEIACQEAAGRRQGDSGGDVPTTQISLEEALVHCAQEEKYPFRGIPHFDHVVQATLVSHAKESRRLACAIRTSAPFQGSKRGSTFSFP